MLKNIGPKYIDATDDLAPDLKQKGMVTSAIFSDVDGDNWVDPMVTYEWGPVRYFNNNLGKLIERTSEVGLDSNLDGLIVSVQEILIMMVIWILLLGILAITQNIKPQYQILNYYIMVILKAMVKKI